MRKWRVAPITSPDFSRSAFRSLYNDFMARTSSAPERVKPLAMNRSGNNPLSADQSRFTVRLENTRVPLERNHGSAVGAANLAI